MMTQQKLTGVTKESKVMREREEFREKKAITRWERASLALP